MNTKRLLIIVSSSCFFFGTASALAMDAMPFEDQATVVDQAAAITALERQREAGELLAGSLDGIWDTLVTEEGSFFQDIIEGLNPLLAIGFAMWVIRTLPAILQSRGQAPPWGLIARPLIVIILLANGGSNLISLSQASRTVIYSVNDAILNSTINGVENRAHIQNAIFSEAIERTAQEKIASCNTELEGEARDACIEQVTQQIEDLVTEVGGDVPDNLVESIGHFVSIGLQSIVIGGLTTVAALFHGVLAYGLAVFVVLSPITIGLTIIPMKFNGFQVYSAGILSAGLMIIFYTGASAVTAALFAVPGNHALYILISAIANPFIAIGIGVAGFAGIYIGTGAALKVVGSRFLR